MEEAESENEGGMTIIMRHREGEKEIIIQKESLDRDC